MEDKRKDDARFDDSPILIPKSSFAEGYIKSHKAIRLECNFNGTIFTVNRVIIDSSSQVTGDVICSDLILSGTIIGNVFCVGRVTMNKGARVIGKIYTSMFTNEHETNLDCVIQIPSQTTFAKAEQILNELDMEHGLSNDPILTKVRELFYKNAFARTNHPDKVIVNKFTEQHETGPNKVPINTKQKSEVALIQDDI